MTQPPPHPALTPQFCFNTLVLRDFLRMSRSSIDDSISQNLNALLTPSTAGFDPLSTSTRTPRPYNRRIIPSICQSFKGKVLFPSWQARSDVLNYCASVAMSPDPDDPEAVLRQVESEERIDDRVVDEKLDPYSARFLPREARAERLAAVVRQERAVENIVRARSWSLVVDRCGEDFKEWEEALDEWRRGRDGR